ncbi:hypothetical protein KDH83_09215 [Achromobacter sp. Marseille-Q0513]|uniref:hypothetical protein n=1 Tax=Achromobacter sp. Marseille-Q0513 TaxID=2829161 RepID=UPI001B99E7C9|nr:hypothetical protein [Achromobacter sp. Marseille-Q0513]MBR8653483.1 hypothetical protein [Achromobacter sp. Marseille-Q0513]
MTIETIERQLGRELPPAYKHFLGQFSENAIISFRCDEEALNRGNWTFVGANGLQQALDVKRSPGLPWWQILHRHWLDSAPRTAGHLSAQDEQAVRMRVAVAYDEGDILYIDALNDFRVGVYLHDSNELIDSGIDLEDIFSSMSIIYSA